MIDDLNRLGEMIAAAEGVPFTNIPKGILLTPGKGRILYGISGNGEQAAIDYEVHEDGTVTCTEGYEPLIDGDYITGFRVLAEATGGV